MALKSGFGKARETYSMHVKLAYAMSVAAPVAMLAGCSKKSDDEAGRDAAARAVPAVSDMRAAGTGRAAPSVCRIAQWDSDRDNGARLAIEEINAQGSKIGMHATRRAARAGGAAIDRATGMPIARHRAADRDAATAGRVERRTPGFRGNAGDVQMSLIPVHFDSTKPRVAATHRVAAGGLLRFTDSDAVLTKVGRHLRDAGSGAARAAADGPLAAQATASGIGAQTLGDNGMCAAKVVEPASDAARNLICPEAGFAPARTEKGMAFGKPDIGRCGTLPYDFKEAKYTVLDVVTI
ncbi:branched-chain amino acid ABC transporter [Burkholderia diffusa]|uniref:Branched-chain amino acid ABC transporter n=2 Tax=Burkholderia diffusa TaxID=488732 RepID=A0AAW3PLY4_9BURK|nr:branched-chain amino acid ABC transporter [Burkholderia diffusa]KWF41162.1 branched-chain amino acid ABC transporter [Burkholderia diffusa]KWF47872.1 branched-chain amino acid ABC transporter [Burkholderia diffusa]KWF59159.1 branched-chain amino acid ABC transporter [Burkholderia diffusa]